MFFISQLFPPAGLVPHILSRIDQDFFNVLALNSGHVVQDRQYARIGLVGFIMGDQLRVSISIVRRDLYLLYYMFLLFGFAPLNVSEMGWYLISKFARPLAPVIYGCYADLVPLCNLDTGQITAKSLVDDLDLFPVGQPMGMMDVTHDRPGRHRAKRTPGDDLF